MDRPPRKFAKSFRLRCRVCGCSDYDACWHDLLGACWWVQPDLCSHCARGLRCKRDSEIAAEIEAVEQEHQRRLRARARRRARLAVAHRHGKLARSRRIH